jgi:V8-like Glu-specific endopeptidase
VSSNDDGLQFPAETQSNAGAGVLKLSGGQQAKLRGAVLAAFDTYFALQALAQDQFSENLAARVSPGSLDQQAFELIKWMIAQGRTSELLMGIRAQNPGNPEILAFLRSVGLTAESSAEAPVLQKVIATNTVFVNVPKWRLLLDQREFQVGRVEQRGRARGTAFLVGPDLVLTNRHVIANAIGTNAVDWSVRFDYKSVDGVAVSAGNPVAFHPEWLVDHALHSPLDTKLIEERSGGEPSAEHLDFALVRLRVGIGDEPRGGTGGPIRGWIPLSTDEVDWAELKSLAILQHPEGEPLKLSMAHPAAVITNPPENSRVRYQVPTKPGSSGSPVFDGDWTLVCLHHSGDPRIIDFTYNEGIPTQLIAARPKVAAALPQKQ